MDIKEEIYEISRKIDTNSGKIGLVRRRLHDLQDEESLYRRDAVRRAQEIEDMPSVLQGDILSKLQMEAFAALDDIRKDAENAFLTERDQLEDLLKSLESENDELLQKKRELMEES